MSRMVFVQEETADRAVNSTNNLGGRAGHLVFLAFPSGGG